MATTRRGLALAGGGPIGAIYEVGALLALDEALTAGTLTNFDVFVGVSSGSFFAAGLANGMTAREMFESFIENSADDPFDPAVLLRPAVGEFIRRAVGLPALLVAGRTLDRPSGRAWLD
jgi:predicted acylesterase/phospholipase RssA